MQLFLLLFVVAFSFVTIGCDKPQTEPVAKIAAREEICWRCGGHKFEVDDTTATFDYQGKTYYFCTEDCKIEFAKDPAHYLPKKEG